jgi:hypothetical protein
MQHTTQHTRTTRFAASLFATLLLGIIMFMGLGAKGQAALNYHYKHLRFENQTNSSIHLSYKLDDNNCNPMAVGGGFELNSGFTEYVDFNQLLALANITSTSLSFSNWSLGGVTVLACLSSSSNPCGTSIDEYAGWKYDGPCIGTSQANVNGFTLTIGDPVFDGTTFGYVLPIVMN